jgi:hypothetical protein
MIVAAAGRRYGKYFAAAMPDKRSQDAEETEEPGAAQGEVRKTFDERSRCAP